MYYCDWLRSLRNQLIGQKADAFLWIVTVYKEKIFLGFKLKYI